MEELIKRVTHCFIKTSLLHRNIVDKKLSKTGVYRGQHHILMLLSRKKGISQKEIAKEQEITTATVAVALKKLEQGGYITRDVQPNDNRYNEVTITEKGNQVVKLSQKIFKRIDTAMFQGFSEKELLNFQQYLERVHENLMEYSYKEEEG